MMMIMMMMMHHFHIKSVVIPAEGKLNEQFSENTDIKMIIKPKQTKGGKLHKIRDDNDNNDDDDGDDDDGWETYTERGRKPRVFPFIVGFLFNRATKAIQWRRTLSKDKVLLMNA